MTDPAFSKNTDIFSIISPIMLLAFLMLFIFLGMVLGSGFTALIAHLQGVDLTTIWDTSPEDNTVGYRNFIRSISFVNHFLTFTIPALILGYLLHRSHWMRFFKLNQTPSFNLLFFSTVLIIVAFPLAQAALWLNQQILLPEWMVNLEESTGATIQNLLLMESVGELIFSLIVMALMPAIGEELIFRGILQPTLARQFRNPILGLWLAALLFSLFHLQFAGFVPRFLLGALLGYLFYWTKNLWLPILAHFVFNGVQVVGIYFMKDQFTPSNLGEPVELPIGITIISFILVLVICFCIQQNSKTRVPSSDEIGVT